MYFVTLCTLHRQCYLGEVTGGVSSLSAAGRLALGAWQAIPVRFPHVRLDSFVIMPNHLHGILVIGDATAAWPGTASDLESAQPPTTTLGSALAVGSSRHPTSVRSRPTLGQVVAYFKYQSSKLINNLRVTPGVPVWQRNYFEHIVRHQQSLERIRDYIENNPLRWHLDRENPAISGPEDPWPM
ncbi:MAG: transposase [Thermoanaerobaculia bacterium]